MKIKVGFHIQALKSGHQARGIGIYTRYLLENLQLHHEVQIYKFEDLSDLKDVDLIHYPYFDLFQPSLPFIRPAPTIVTIHDVIPIMFPEHYPPGIRGKLCFHYQKLALKTVARVLTDSYSAKQEIVKFLGVPLEKVSVIPLAPQPFFRPIKNKRLIDKVRRKYKLPKQFLIFIGNVNWNKNILNIAQAAVEAGTNLVFVGKSFESRQNLNHPELKTFRIFLEKFEHHPLIKILGYVADDDLTVLLNAAQALMLVSYAEGFGLPILEAQKCEVPVITSNRSSMVEIAGKGALFVDPEKVEEIKKAIQQVMENPGLRQRLIAEGKINARKFSWAKTADETVKIYKQILYKAIGNE